jgi:hypothetical protein
MKVDTFDFAAVTIGGEHVTAGGTLIYKTQDTGRTEWEASATADNVPPSIRNDSREDWDVVFHAGSRSLRGKASVTIGAVVKGGTGPWPIQFTGTGKLEGI